MHLAGQCNWAAKAKDPEVQRVVEKLTHVKGIVEVPADGLAVATMRLGLSGRTSPHSLSPRRPLQSDNPS
jgi:hypothetical protein